MQCSLNGSGAIEACPAHTPGSAAERCLLSCGLTRLQVLKGKHHFQTIHAKVGMLPVEPRQQSPCSSCSLPQLSHGQSDPPPVLCLLQFGLATFILAVIAPLGGALSFKQWGFISQLPERWQPWVKAAHRNIGRITLLLSFVTIQLILGHHSAYTVWSTSRAQHTDCWSLQVFCSHGGCMPDGLSVIAHQSKVEGIAGSSHMRLMAQTCTSSKGLGPLLSDDCSYTAFRLSRPRT